MIKRPLSQSIVFLAVIETDCLAHSQVAPHHLPPPLATQFTKINTRVHQAWRGHTNVGPGFSYRVDSPSDWTISESGPATTFSPGRGQPRQGNISIVVIDSKKTPPLPVHYIYTTLRTVQVGNEMIAVKHRQPSSVNELYFADLHFGDYTVEFRFSLARHYDDVFDHMISTFAFTH